MRDLRLGVLHVCLYFVVRYTESSSPLANAQLAFPAG